MRLPVDSYIGLPFKSHGRDRRGLDCWGLACLVFREQLGIELPSYAEAYADARGDRAAIDAEIAARRGEGWAAVPPGEEKPGDLMLFRVGGSVCHVGVVVDPAERLMLHCEAAGIGSCVERWDSPAWRLRGAGCFRFTGRPPEPDPPSGSVEQAVVPVRWRTGFVPDSVEIRELPAGLSLAEIVHRLVGDEGAGGLRVHLGDDPAGVPAWHWHRVYPKRGTQVLILAVPQGGGGGGGKVLRTALMVGVLAASLTIPGAVGLAAGGLGSSLLGAGIGVAGSLAVNALAPIPKPKMAERDPPGGQQFSLEGASNTVNPFGVIPLVLGRIRVVPPLATKPYAERVGADQYLRVVVLWGYGPVTVSDIRVGRTPIEELEGVTAQHRWNPGGGDPDLSLFPRIVNEDRLSLELIGGSGWQTRSTSADTVEILLELTCPSGLQRISSNGKSKGAYSVTLEYRYRPTGGAWSPATQVLLTSESTEPLFHVIRIGPLAAATYEVQVRRITPNVPDQDRSRIQDRVFWSMLQSFEMGDPVDAPGVARSAFRIKASDLANGQIEISGVVQTVGRDWNGTAWVAGTPIRNPAALFRWVAQHPQALATPRTDAQLDIVGLQSWHARCKAKGWAFDAVFDFEASLDEVLARIATVGRASLFRGYGKLGVVQDRPDLSPVQLFTPRNSRNLQLTRELIRRPHAFRVRFQNEAKEWSQEEVLVYDDHHGPATATRFETLELFGITSESEARSFARRTLAIAALRPETVTFETDWEYLAAPLGSLVHLQHDAILVGVASGRVVSRVLQNNNTECVSITLDERVPLDGTAHAIRRRAATGAIVTLPIANHSGETATLTFSPPATSGFPSIGDLVAVGKVGVETLPLIVTGVECRGDWDTATITAVPYAPEIENADQEIGVFDPRITLPRVIGPGREPGLPRPEVLSVRSDEPVLQIGPDGTFIPAIVVVLGPPQVAPDALVRTDISWRLAGSSAAFRTIAVPAEQREARITGVRPGDVYQLSLRHIYRDLYGPGQSREKLGPSTGLNHRVIGATTPPDAVTGLHQDGDLIRWSGDDRAPDHAGWLLRSSAEADTPWAFATAAHEGLLTEASFTVDRIDPDHDHVLVAAVDRTGLRSVEAKSLKLVRQRPRDRLIAVERSMSAEGYPGILQGGTRISGDEGRPVLRASLLSAYFGPPEAPFWDLAANGPYFDFRYAPITYTTTYTVPDEIEPDDGLRVVAVASMPITVLLRWRRGQQVTYLELDAPLLVEAEDLHAPFYVAGDALDAPFLSLEARPNPWVAPRQDIRALPGETLDIRIESSGGHGLEPHQIQEVLIAITAFERIETHPGIDLAPGGTRVSPRRPMRRVTYAEADLHDSSSAFVRREQRDAVRDGALGPLFRAYRLVADQATPMAARADVRIGGV